MALSRQAAGPGQAAQGSAHPYVFTVAAGEKGGG